MRLTGTGGDRLTWPFAIGVTIFRSAIIRHTVSIAWSTLTQAFNFKSMVTSALWSLQIQMKQKTANTYDVHHVDGKHHTPAKKLHTKLVSEIAIGVPWHVVCYSVGTRPTVTEGTAREPETNFTTRTWSLAIIWLSCKLLPSVLLLSSFIGPPYSDNILDLKLQRFCLLRSDNFYNSIHDALVVIIIRSYQKQQYKILKVDRWYCDTNLYENEMPLASIFTIYSRANHHEK